MLNRPSDWALITGASKGIGRATAKRLAALGYGVVLLARHEEELQSLAREIKQGGASVLWFNADITSEEAIQRVKQELEHEQLRLQALVLNAGIARIGKVLEMPLAEWRQIMEVNFFAQVQMVQILFPLLDKAAHIVFVNSVAGRAAFPDWGAYSASKFALRALADALRQEVAESGIKVTSVYPSSTDTPLHDSLGLAWDRNKMLKAEDVAQAITSALTLKGGAQVEEIILGNVQGLF